MPNDSIHELIYDISQQGFQDTPWLAGAALGLLLAVGTWWWRRHQGRPAKTAGFFVVFSGVAASAVAMTAWDHHRLVAKLQAGQVQRVEGPVLAHALQVTATWNTSSKRYDRSTWESFHVGGTAFVYRRGGGVGFHNGTEPPVAISDGQRLRVLFVEDVANDRSQRRILRLERLCSTACAAHQG